MADKGRERVRVRSIEVVGASRVARGREASRHSSTRSDVCHNSVSGSKSMGHSDGFIVRFIDVFAERSFLSPFTKESRVNTSHDV